MFYNMNMERPNVPQNRVHKVKVLHLKFLCGKNFPINKVKKKERKKDYREKQRVKTEKGQNRGGVLIEDWQVMARGKLRDVIKMMNDVKVERMTFLEENK